MNDFIIENGILKEYTGPGGDVVIPDGVTEIGDEAFLYRFRIHNLVIPESVTKIGNEAFAYCDNLEKIVVPGSVKVLGEYAFAGCNAMQEAVLSEGVEEIGAHAFAHCNYLMHMHLPESVTRLGYRAFVYCTELRSLEIPGRVTEIGKGLLMNTHSLEILIAPFFPWKKIDELDAKTPAVLGHLLHPEKFWYSPYVTEYHRYISMQSNQLLPEIFQRDAAQALGIYSALGKITGKNFHRYYLQPAMEANAHQCVAWLLNWRDEHSAPGTTDNKWIL